MEKLIVYNGVEAGLVAVLNQVATIDRDYELAAVRIAKLKATMKERAMERCDAILDELEEESRLVRAKHIRHVELTLAHKTSERCALEPGWDVVQ